MTEMNQEIKPIPELEDMSKLWYNSPSIAFNMIDSMKFRESVLIAKNRVAVQRMLKINAIRFMYKNFERYRFHGDEYLYNVFNSVAHFPQLPMTSFKAETKKDEMALFNANYGDYIKGYDLFIDLDNENMDLVYASTKKLKDLFDKYKLPYVLTYSGSKGFHLTIDYKDLPDQIKDLPYKDIAHLFKLFAYELKISEKIKDVDNSIYDLRRIKKTPYSVVYPYYRVALPLSDEQFNNFKVSDVFLPNLIEKVESFNHRGLLTREGTSEGLLKLMSYVALKQRKSDNLFKLLKMNKKTLFGFMKKKELIIE